MHKASMQRCIFAKLFGEQQKIDASGKKLSECFMTSRQSWESKGGPWYWPDSPVSTNWSMKMCMPASFSQYAWGLGRVLYSLLYFRISNKVEILDDKIEENNLHYYSMQKKSYWTFSLLTYLLWMFFNLKKKTILTIP